MVQNDILALPTGITSRSYRGLDIFRYVNVICQLLPYYVYSILYAIIFELSILKWITLYQSAWNSRPRLHDQLITLGIPLLSSLERPSEDDIDKVILAKGLQFGELFS